MTPEYDLEGCYYLIIAILKGVGANQARRLYEGNAKHLVVGENPIHKNKRILKESCGKEELKQIKNAGYSYEQLSEIYNCDLSTIKRLLKMEEST